MKFTEILFSTLTEEVKNKKLFNTLMDKWRTEKPNITDEEGEELFNLFGRIQGNLRPDLPQVFTFLNRYDGEHGYQRFEPNTLKDITKYTYGQLKFLLDEYNTDVRRTEDVFAGKDTAPSPERIDASKNLWFGSNNIILDKDGLRVYDIADQQMSIRYGYYYHTVFKNAIGRPDASDREISPWCVTWRPDMGKSNMWGNYRSQGRSFYFVIDENKSVDDQYYMSALQRDPSASTGFILTSMMNNGDNRVSWEDITRIYPQLNGEKDIIKPKPYSQDELSLKDIVGQITERPGNRYEFKRMERELKQAYIQNGGALQKADSWKSMDSSLRNLYILYPNLNEYTVKERYNNFDFMNEIRKVGNEFNLLDRTLKQKGIKDGAAYILDYLMSNEFKVARISADNKNIRIYESKINGKSGLYNISKNSWVESNGVTYEPMYVHIDTDMYNDSEGETYVVEVYSKSGTPTDDSFYSLYLFGDSNPEFDSHFLSSRKWKELVKDLSPEDGSEPKTDTPKDYADIKEKRGY
jgi:hemin uptake protein HemP